MFNEFKNVVILTVYFLLRLIQCELSSDISEINYNFKCLKWGKFSIYLRFSLKDNEIKIKLV